MEKDSFNTLCRRTTKYAKDFNKNSSIQNRNSNNLQKKKEEPQKQLVKEADA